MIYDLAVMGTKELTQKDYRSMGYTKEQQVYRPQKGELMIEVNRAEGQFNITMLTSDYKLKIIHSKAIIVTTYTALKENSIISFYEVLWAAGVSMDPVTLCPLVSRDYETSIKNIYYREAKREVS